MKTNPLFPEMEQEILDDRKAAKRALVQHARQYLRGRDLSPLINGLLDHGPNNEHMLMLWAMEEKYQIAEGVASAALLLTDLHCLWLTKKLWRHDLGIHPGSGEHSYLYGLRGVHDKPANSD